MSIIPLLGMEMIVKITMLLQRQQYVMIQMTLLLQK